MKFIFKMKKLKYQKPTDGSKKTLLFVCIAVVIFLLLFSLIFSEHAIKNRIKGNTSRPADTYNSDSSYSKDDRNSGFESSNSTAVEDNTTSTVPEYVPSDDEFVRIRDYIPEIIIDLKYSTADNFTGQVIYSFSDAYLRYGTVKKLLSASKELEKSGYRLKIWDAFRPYAAQCMLWDICPDPTYVSNPKTGNLSHCRGGAVDVTLIKADGSQVAMPTDFDDFSSLADRDYSDVDRSVKENALILEECMKRNGFTCYFGEWWHYADSTVYPIDYNYMS